MQAILRSLSILLLVVAPTVLLAVPSIAAAMSGESAVAVDLTHTWWGYSAAIIFVVAYVTVICEEFLHLRKSKPVMVAAGAIWILVAIGYLTHGDQTSAAEAVRHNLLEYGELLLFLLAAMTYINTMDERNIFEALRAWLVSSGYSLRAVFWLTGLLAFFISPIADNLTTSLVMAAVVLAVGAGHKKFIALACINIVVAANAGGAFSPFGDITTLMVWQRGLVHFWEFLHLFLPSAVNWLVPAAFMSLALDNEHPAPIEEHVRVKQGGYVVVFLFLCTIALTVTLHQFMYMPPVLGMMTGLGVLKMYGYFLRRDELTKSVPHIVGPEEGRGLGMDEHQIRKYYKPKVRPFDIFISMKRAEWDTLMFFYGVILCVGGLGTLGYLAMLSEMTYGHLGATWANILVGIVSAVVDNIPVMFAVLTMNPDMDLSQWLLVTLTAGVGGSLLSIGSAAGVALMGQARGVYTFFVHLRWTWAVALGYAASVWVHLLIDGT